MATSDLYDAGATTGASPALGEALSRYVAPVGLLAPPHGDLFLRHAIRASNQERLRRHAPHYLRVHLALFAAAALADWLVCSLGPPGASTLTAFALAFEVMAVIVCVGVTIALRLS